MNPPRTERVDRRALNEADFDKVIAVDMKAV
jgi:hypothetical protein